MKFKQRWLEEFWDDPDNAVPKRIPHDLRRTTYRKLQMISAAHVLQDLRVPPRNHLEKLSGDRKGQHSIRVNDQWRLCFVWEDGEAKEVEFCDYH